MLRNLNWLQSGQTFPPVSEVERLERYANNLAIFHNDEWVINNIYQPYFDRISKTISNFGEVFSFPVLLNYQRLMTLKMADLVCGDYPVITGDSDDESEEITEIRDHSAFDEKLYSTIIDISRYGDAIWRVYKDTDGKNTFVVWDPATWFPIVSQDGTNTITQQVLCWIVDGELEEERYLHAQIHSVGKYDYKVFKMDKYKGIISELVTEQFGIRTGLDINAVINLRAFSTSDTVYGSDDYIIVDSLLAEVMVRIAQISNILDKHADPAMTGPASMLIADETNGSMYLKVGRFYAVSPGEDQPKYLTWEGQLDAAFKQIDLLLNQLYIVSEMGTALLGAIVSMGGQAISGTAMRFKMVNPLSKARRIANSLSLPVRRLISAMSKIGFPPLDLKNVSVEWADGLPEDPREMVELVKLITGAEHIMPLETAIIEFYKRTPDEAKRWMEMLKTQQLVEDEAAVNHPGPQNGTGVNTASKGSELGLKNF